jgi:hypothetical protein
MVLIVLDSLTGRHTIVSVPLRSPIRQPTQPSSSSTLSCPRTRHGLDLSATKLRRSC